MEGKKSFVLYADLIHVVKKLPKDKQGELFVMILEYVNDKNPSTEDLILDIAFEPIKLGIIYNWKRSKVGEYNFNWKNGISSENKKIRNGSEIKLWRKEVFKRDKFTCQKCGIKGGHLHAHHILPFAKYESHRFNLENGITLCKECHIQEHKSISEI